MRPTISIIIPCYNGWKYMRPCLESLEKQTESPDEVIIIDDCSKDDSFDCLVKYKESSNLNIVLDRNNTNSGPGQTRENALKYVTSSYVAFCDCDDWYEVDFISNMKKNLLFNNADLIIFNNYICYENGEKKQTHSVDSLLDKTNKEIMALYQMSLWRLLVKKDILDNVCFSHLYHGEDGVVASQIIALSKKVSVDTNSYYNYLMRNNSISSRPSPNAYRELIEAFYEIEKAVPGIYKDEIEFLGIKYISYGAVLNAFKSDVSFRDVLGFLNTFNNQYANWIHNKYLASYPIKKKIFVYSVWIRMLLVPWLFSKAHMLIFKG